MFSYQIFKNLLLEIVTFTALPIRYKDIVIDEDDGEVD